MNVATSSPPAAAGKLPNLANLELLAPAGDQECVRAAVENGADAVYFGLDVGFNARARATNCAVESLPDVMQFLHSRGVRGYLTMNTLAFPSELAQAQDLIRQIAAAGVDAVLVQDLGLVRLIRAICPDLPIHASTQMTLTSAESIAFAQQLGVERVVLARELSIKEIKRINKQTDMPLEAFVHGALCVAYSGQCLTSESLGGRSANRGQCAQACRLPYELVCDGKDVDLGDQKYLLSPQDLAAYDLVPELAEAGICSLKIEGRLKTPEYVANITKHYRRAIDAARAQQALAFTPTDIEEMELSFSRGFSHGWLDGCDHKMLVPALSSAKRGVKVATVREIRGQKVLVQLHGSIKRGDGIMFDSKLGEEHQQGGRVYEIFQRGVSLTGPISKGFVELAFARGAFDYSRILPEMAVWKTDDPELTSRLRKTFDVIKPLRQMPVDVQATAGVGAPLRIVATTEGGVRIELQTEELLAEAMKHPLSQESLAQQLGRLGGTAYVLRNCTAEIEGRPMCPLSVLGKLRHELVERLDQAMVAPLARRIEQRDVLAEMREQLHRQAAEEKLITPEAPQLRVLCRSMAQLQALLELGVRDLYVDFGDIHEYGKAVKLAHSFQASIFLATPRIQKPAERGIFHVLHRHGANGILARNLGGLMFFASRQVPTIADFSLNAANELTAELLRQHGASRVTASYDLNRDQLLDMVSHVPPAWLEIVAHQHMPMFHMEHCVFCAVISPGTNKTNCGRPCDTHEVKLRDRMGMEHPLTADVGCRNTLLNAVPQSAAEIVPLLVARGIRHFRLELLNETAEEIARVVEIYRQLLAGEVTGRDVWTQLNAVNRVGVTRGTLEERRNPLAII